MSWLFWLWRPERQVRLHTTHFLKKVEQRNWEGARSFLAGDFADAWKHDKTTAIEDAREVFSQFLFLTIESRTDRCEFLGADGTALTVVKISGTGGPVSQLVTEKVNGLREPFAFTWRHVGKAPWSWQLIRIGHPALKIDPNAEF